MVLPVHMLARVLSVGDQRGSGISLALKTVHMCLTQPIAATILSLSQEKDALAMLEMFKCLASVYDLITGVFSAHFDHPKILHI